METKVACSECGHELHVRDVELGANGVDIFVSIDTKHDCNPEKVAAEVSSQHELHLGGSVATEGGA